MTEMLVTTRADAIYLSAATQVIGPISDPEIMPWFDGQRDHNTQSANLGSAINAEPFADHQTWLEAGVHVHWALPNALTRGGNRRTSVRSVHVDNKWFPPVPNRWLVTRTLVEESDNDMAADRAWLIESDYVHPPGPRPVEPCTAYPRTLRDDGQSRPWLYIGRQIELSPDTYLPLDVARSRKSGNHSLAHHGAPLAAISPLDPFFSAHYPSCRGVFGVYDDAPHEDREQAYEVFGWYSTEHLDPLSTLVKDLKSDEQKAFEFLVRSRHESNQEQTVTHPSELSEADWNSALGAAVSEHFGRFLWHDGGVFPTHIICQARTVINPVETQPVEQPFGQSKEPVAIGSSAAEAVAAYLLDSGETIAEDSLVQSLAATDLASHPLDLGQKLREARHNEQFRAYRGHEIWAIRPHEESQSEGHQSAVELNDDVAHELNRLNELQEHYNNLHDRIDHLRQELFADWSHYMQVAYPNGERDPFAIDPGVLEEHIDRTRLKPLEALLAEAGNLQLLESDFGDQLIGDDLHFLKKGDTAYGPVVGTLAGREIVLQRHNGKPLSAIRVNAGAIVDAVQLVFADQPSERIGGTGGDPHEFVLREGEWLTELYGHLGEFASQRVIANLGGRTNLGRSFNAGSRPGARKLAFHLQAPPQTAITGLRGHAESYLSALGLIVSPLYTEEAPENQLQTVAHEIKKQHAAVRSLLQDTQGDINGVTDSTSDTVPANSPGANQMTLGLTPGPRYWRPHDPVIMLMDDHARPSDRHMPNATHISQAFKVFYTIHMTEWDQTDHELTGKATAFFAGDQLSVLWGARSAITQQSVNEGWHPLHLEWQAQIEPLLEGSNISSDAYNADFVTRKHQFIDDAADIEPTGAGKLSTRYEYISGRSTLNASIGQLMLKRYNNLPSSQRDPLKILPGTPTILPLGGFHDQLLMQRAEPQLPIADPIGVPSQQQLAERVRKALHTFHPNTPLPDAGYHPVRSGELVIERLRMIDVFGRSKEWRPTTVVKTRRMRPARNRDDRVHLPLRLTQPARLNFRWLSGAHRDDVESNSHPAASPICGWVLLNELDGELDIYDRDGLLLGTINSAAEWTQAPGNDHAPRAADEIIDESVTKVVDWLVSTKGSDLVGRFIDALDVAMHQVDPMDAARHQARAMLISRPLAIVRARLSLSLKGGLPEDQSLEALRSRIDGATASVTHGAESVKFPVRLGEHGQLNDGLCGYWIEKGRGFRGQMFHTPHGVKVNGNHDHIRVLSNEKLRDYPLQLSLDAVPVTVTLLMDPRGTVHATTGILPVKSIAIPESQYHDHINSLRTVFPAGPVISPTSHLAMPLPEEPGYSWSWLEKNAADWTEIPHHPTLSEDDLVSEFGIAGSELWARLVELGRIVIEDRDDVGVLMPGKADALPDRFKDLDLTVEQVETALHRLANWIERTETHAHFESRNEARNGWLQLRPLPDSATNSADSETDA